MQSLFATLLDWECLELQLAKTLLNIFVQPITTFKYVQFLGCWSFLQVRVLHSIGNKGDYIHWEWSLEHIVQMG